MKKVVGLGIMCILFMVMVIPAIQVEGLPLPTYKSAQSGFGWTGDVSEYTISDSGVSTGILTDRSAGLKEIETEVKDSYETLDYLKIETSTPDSGSYCDYRYEVTINDGNSFGLLFEYSSNQIEVSRIAFGNLYSVYSTTFTEGHGSHVMYVESTESHLTITGYVDGSSFSIVSYPALSDTSNVDFTLSTSYGLLADDEDVESWSLTVRFQDTPHIVLEQEEYTIGGTSETEIPFTVQYEGNDIEGGYVGFEASYIEYFDSAVYGTTSGSGQFSIGIIGGKNYGISQPFSPVTDMYLGSIRYVIDAKATTLNHRVRVLDDLGTVLFEKSQSTTVKTFTINNVNIDLEGGEDYSIVWDIPTASQSTDYLTLRGTNLKTTGFTNYGYVAPSGSISYRVGMITVLLTGASEKLHTITDLDNNDNKMNAVLSSSSFSGTGGVPGYDFTLTFNVSGIADESTINITLNIYDHDGRFLSGVRFGSNQQFEVVVNGTDRPDPTPDPVFTPGFTLPMLIVSLVIVNITMLLIRKYGKNGDE